MELLDRTTHQTRCPYKGDASLYRHAGGLVRQNAVWSYETNPAVSRIAGHMAFHLNKVDAIDRVQD